MAEEAKPDRVVIIAVDGSDHAWRAFEFYISAIHQYGDKAILLHAFELPPLPYSSGPCCKKALQRTEEGEGELDDVVFAYYEEWSAMVKETREQHEAMLRSYEDICKDKKLHYEIMMVVGKPAGDVICQVARDVSANLIVLGTRGQGMIRRTILGSVSDYVVHHSHLPVAVIPAPQEPEQQA
ncbi:universal stress protein Slr1101 isoform X1 [Nematostella vectensis]|uniref:universal stress protein Slr1101 isoform X1 n=1 Tax=Nematostella vectensis TaxID=45351 RepID=UPI002076DD13|nr:universal stress protein Slr1101 isoform X1 [Nematostella vectensis]